MVWVLFTAFGTCQSSSASSPVASLFLAFEALQGCWDILFNPLKTSGNFSILEHFLPASGRPPQQASFHSLFSLHFWWLTLIAMTFSMRKGENLARQTMNLKKSAASFSESDSDRFLFVFC